MKFLYSIFINNNLNSKVINKMIKKTRKLHPSFNVIF